MSLQPPAPIAPSVAAAAAAEQALQVQLLSDQARAPTKGSAFAAGHDLYSARHVVIPARGRARVDTDISIAVPAGTYGRVAPRSGLAAKHGIDTMAGVIDADYRGQVGVILANLSETDFEVNVGDRIAQLIVEKVRFCCSPCGLLSNSYPFLDCHARSGCRREARGECAGCWWLWQHGRLRECSPGCCERCLIQFPVPDMSCYDHGHGTYIELKEEGSEAFRGYTIAIAWGR